MNITQARVVCANVLKHVGHEISIPAPWDTRGKGQNREAFVNTRLAFRKKFSKRRFGYLVNHAFGIY
jgi:hypothetical protein